MVHPSMARTVVIACADGYYSTCECGWSSPATYATEYEAQARATAHTVGGA